MAALTPDQIWDAVQHNMSHDVTCRIVTSGYDDRWLQMSSKITVRLRWPALLQWDNLEHSRSTLLALTGRSLCEINEATGSAKTTYLSTWYNESYTISKTAPVRPPVLVAICHLAQHQVRHNFSTKEEARCIQLMREATQDELDCARYWLSKCNRTNARIGRAQVPVPTLE